MKKERFQSDRVLAYFRLEWKVLVLITLSGLIYNLGLLAGPWFEGKMSIRFRNSGRIVFFNMFITSFLVSSTTSSLLELLSFSI